MAEHKIVNLRGTNGIIIKIRCRDRNGRNVHKNQFSVDDRKSVERELRTWKDKLGVPLDSFRNIVNNPIDDEELQNIREMMKKDIQKGNEEIKEFLK